MNDDQKRHKTILWECVKAIATVLVTGVVSFKLYETPFNVTVDFPMLLSLFLALFSVGLAALFYFKATETSNTFYDNTYNFTKDIAQLLAKMESGFGERLRHLDEGYSSMLDYLQQTPNRSEEVESTKEEIELEKKEIERMASERSEIITELIEQSQLEAEEKESIQTKLTEKEGELTEAREELLRMNLKLAVEGARRNRVNSVESGLGIYTRKIVIDRIGSFIIARGSPSRVRREFGNIADSLPKSYLDDMESEGFYDDGLTLEGFRFLREIARLSDAGELGV